MDLLELKTYSRHELEQLFHTSRTDSIRRSLERAGYTFQSSGRGKTYQIQITALPSPPSEFAAFAQKHFDCGEQTNFDVMKLYLYLLFYHSEFRYFPAVYQSQYIKENYSIEISDQTLRNWRRKLEEKNLISTDEEDTRFYACRREQKPRAITEEEHKSAWREFYSRFEAGEHPDEVRKEIYYKNDGMPRKQYGFSENALEHEILAELHRILENTSKYNEIIKESEWI